MTKDFWNAALIRAIKTICQTAVAVIGTAAVMSDVNWAMVLSASCLAGILSILTSIAVGLPEVDLQTTMDLLKEYEMADGEIEEDEDEDDFQTIG